MFVRHYGAQDPDERIMLINVDGTNERELLRTRSIVAPKWSPDGTNIAFSGKAQNSEESGLFVVPSDGVGPRLILGDLTGGPDWSPDSSTLVFGNNSPNLGGVELWKLDVATGTQTQLTFPPGDNVQDSSPVWSPDGTKVAFVRTWNYNGGYYDSDIYVVNSSGGDPVQMTDTSRGEERVDWQPLCNGACAYPTWEHGLETHERTLSLRLSRYLRGSGRLTVVDGLFECLRGQRIKVQRKIDGRWKVIERTIVDDTGRYEVALNSDWIPGSFVYRAVAANRTVGLYKNHTCGSARSNRVRR